MRIPGIRNIGFCTANCVSDDIELQGMTGIAANIAGLRFTPLYVLDDGVMDLSESNDMSSSMQKVTLTFTCLSDYKPGQHVFLVQTVAGTKWLIGSKTSVPAIATQDTTAAAGNQNSMRVTVELSAPLAAQRVIGQEAIITDGGFVTFEDWRQIADGKYSLLEHTHTKAEISDFEHRHDTTDLDDEDFNNTQDNINQQLLELAYAGL